MKNKAVVLVAGGSGERAKSNTPKQFVELYQKPILVHALEKFISTYKDIICIIVTHESYLSYTKEIVSRYFPNTFEIHYTQGGKTRFESVKNGLEMLNQLQFNGIVAIHDAARPCISKTLINRCFEIAEKKGNAIPVIPITESIRYINGSDNKFVRRDDFVIVQTPQCVDFKTLYNAFQQAYQEQFTDEANVLEHCGEKINLCEGEKHNIKITYPIDFEIAKVIIESLNEQ